MPKKNGKKLNNKILYHIYIFYRLRRQNFFVSLFILSLMFNYYAFSYRGDDPTYEEVRFTFIDEVFFYFLFWPFYLLSQEQLGLAVIFEVFYLYTIISFLSYMTKYLKLADTIKLFLEKIGLVIPQNRFLCEFLSVFLGLGIIIIGQVGNNSVVAIFTNIVLFPIHFFDVLSVDNVRSFVVDSVLLFIYFFYIYILVNAALIFVRFIRTYLKNNFSVKS